MHFLGCRVKNTKRYNGMNMKFCFFNPGIFNKPGYFLLTWVFLINPGKSPGN